MSNKPWEGGSFSHWPTIRRVDRPGMTATEVLMREQERKFYSSPPTHYGFDVNAAQEIYEQYRQSLGLPIVEPRAISGALLCNVLPDSVPETPKTIGEFLGEHGCTLSLGSLDLLRREAVSFDELGAKRLASRLYSALHSNNDSWRYCTAFLVPYAEPFLRNAVADGASFYDPSQRGGVRDQHALAYINRLAHLACNVRNEYLETHGDDADTEEDNTMNLRNAVYLIPDDLVTVIAVECEGAAKLTYLCEQGLAKQLSAALGDKKRPIVAVRRNGRDYETGGVAIDLAEVLEVHAEPVIDMNYKGVYHYVVGLVDPSGILAREREDAKVFTMLKRKQQSSARDQVLAGLGIGDRKEFLEHVRSTVDAVESDDVGGGDAAD